MDRRQSGNAKLSDDFGINHRSLLNCLCKLVSKNTSSIVEIIQISGSFTEDQQAEQKTPAFWITWICRISGTNRELTIHVFAFGPTYNNLAGSVEMRRCKMLESASIAYTAATYLAAEKLHEALKAATSKEPRGK